MKMGAFSKFLGAAAATALVCDLGGNSLLFVHGFRKRAFHEAGSLVVSSIKEDAFVQTSGTVGMKCEDGTVLDGTTGPERTMTVKMICEAFAKHPWQYPILGYKNEKKGVGFPWDCKRQMGGYVYANAGLPTCPSQSPEQVHHHCLSSDVPIEIIRDMACVVRRDPKKLGRFLNNKNQTRNKFELAAFFAHLGQETGDFRTMWEADGNAGQYCSYFYPGDEKYCQESLFFGRGVHQLTHPSNYADFSDYWFKDKKVLLEKPELLIDSMETSWASAIWFWMEPRQHHNGDAYCARWTLMHDALFTELGFGQTISAINGGLECSGANQVGPWQRLGRLIYFLDIFGIEMPFFEDGDLKAIPKWFTEGCSYIETYKLKVRRASWKELEGGGECKGFNQPYLCGWGGVTKGPAGVPNPLIAFNTGGGAESGPVCNKDTSPKGGRNEWPHPIVKDEGYYKVGETSSEPEETTKPSTTKPTTAKPTTTTTTRPTTTTTRPTTTTTEPTTTTTAKTETEAPEEEKPAGTCSGCHVSQLKPWQWYECNAAGAATFCTAPWDTDGDDECCTKSDFETFANTQGCTCV